MIGGFGGNDIARLESQGIIVEDMIDHEGHPSPGHLRVLRWPESRALELLNQRLARGAVKIAAQQGRTRASPKLELDPVALGMVVIT